MADIQHTVKNLPVYYGLLRLIKLQEQILSSTENEIINRYAHVLYLILQPEPQTQQSLAHILVIDKASVVRIIDQLEKANIVKREVHPQDRRCYLLKPTSKAEKLKPLIALKFEEMSKAMFKGLNKTEINAIRAQMLLMHEQLLTLNNQIKK
jgi:DNA-binding MarR family transcriptional regulator